MNFLELTQAIKLLSFNLLLKKVISQTLIRVSTANYENIKVNKACHPKHTTIVSQLPHTFTPVKPAMSNMEKPLEQLPQKEDVIKENTAQVMPDNYFAGI